MLKLVGTDGTKYYSFEITPGRHSVGRKPECDICIPNQTISRNHAELEIGEGFEECYLTDRGSHNGTAVNGRRITGRVPIKAGDSISFGQAEFKLSSGAEPDARPSRPTATRISEIDPEKSVYLSIDEALKPLPSKVTDLPNVFPTLSEMARMLVLYEPREVMLKKSLELVTRVIPADRLAVLTRSEEGGEIITAALHLPTGKEMGEFTLSRTIIDDILTHKQAVLVGDPTQNPKYAHQDSIILSEMKSAMAVPLADEGEVLGILYVDTTNPLHRYSDDFLRLLATFGNIIASRLANYTLVEERQEKKLMEAELEKASQIQHKLLVECAPEVTGFKACAYQDQCRAVGGDLYDMTLLPDGRFLFLVADVSGKGLGAALLMSNILASFRILYEREGFAPGEAVSQVSKQLYNFSNPGDYATLFIAVIDPTANRLTFVNAGHNPPCLVGRDGTIRLLDATGLVIGAIDFDGWTETEMELSRGDTIFVFTDGVSEAEREGGDMYGEERLEKLLAGCCTESPDQIAQTVVNDIEAFVRDHPQSDDITMMIVQRDN